MRKYREKVPRGFALRGPFSFLYPNYNNASFHHLTTILMCVALTCGFMLI